MTVSLNDRLLTAAAVAEICGVAPSTVHDWVESEKLEAIRLGGKKGGRLRIPERALLAMLDAGATAREPSRRPLDVV